MTCRWEKHGRDVFWIPTCTAGAIRGPEFCLCEGGIPPLPAPKALEAVSEALFDHINLARARYDESLIASHQAVSPLERARRWEAVQESRATMEALSAALKAFRLEYEGYFMAHHETVLEEMARELTDDAS